MAEYEIVDSHVHLCRDLAQEKLVFPKHGWLDNWYWGSPERVVPYMDARGISHVVTLNIMDTRRMSEMRIGRLPKDTSEEDIQKTRAALKDEMRERIRRFNDWACETQETNPRIIAYVMIDPGLFGADSVKELERCAVMGARGAKVHPMMCCHMPDDENLMPVYQRCQELGLGVLSDTGEWRRPNLRLAHQMVAGPQNVPEAQVRHGPLLRRHVGHSHRHGPGVQAQPLARHVRWSRRRAPSA